jgi:hypothetical protein
MGNPVIDFGGVDQGCPVRCGGHYRRDLTKIGVGEHCERSAPRVQRVERVDVSGDPW